MGRHCPVAYIAPRWLLPLAFPMSEALRRYEMARSQFCGTPRPYRYFSPVATRAAPCALCSRAARASELSTVAEGFFGFVFFATVWSAFAALAGPDVSSTAADFSGAVA